MSDGGECFDGHLGDGPGGRRVLPAGFADLPGGPELAAAVASVDADGGATAVDNIAPLCPRHHKAKTERDWKLQQTGPGEHTLTDPYGRRYRSHAPSLTDPTPAEPAPATAGATKVNDDLPPF